MPRLLLMPPEVSNAGDDAIALYEAVGRRLDGWQQQAVRAGLGETADLQWAAFEVCVICQRQNGKGAVTECVELAALFLFGMRVVIHSAHKLETSLKAFRSMAELINSSPDLKRRCKPINPSDTVIETLSGQRLEFRTRSGSGGRGLTGDLVVLDEALELSPELLAALAPVLLARPFAQLWYTSTVPRFGDAHLCGVRDRALARDQRLAYIEWGADTDAALDDEVQLRRANPALTSGRITLERLGAMRKILGDELFRTECMGIWPVALPGAMLDAAAWARMADTTSRRGLQCAVGVDVSPLRDWTTIGLYSVRDDDLEHVQLLDYREGVDWVPDRIAEVDRLLQPLGYGLDDKNGARALLAALAERGIVVAEDRSAPERGQIMVFGVHEAADSVAGFVDAFRAGRLRHIEQEPLTAAIVNVQPRPIGDSGLIGWGRRRSNVNIGPVVTVAEARYVYHAWHDLISGHYDVLGSIPPVQGQCPHCDAWAPAGQPVQHYDDCVTVGAAGGP